MMFNFINEIKKATEAHIKSIDETSEALKDHIQTRQEYAKLQDDMIQNQLDLIEAYKTILELRERLKKVTPVAVIENVRRFEVDFGLEVTCGKVKRRFNYSDIEIIHEWVYDQGYRIE